MRTDIRHGRRASSRRRRNRAEQVQNRRFVLAVCLLALLVVITAAVSYSSRAEATPESQPTASSGSTATTLDPAASLISATYTAELKSSASGSANGTSRALLTLKYDASAQTISYKLQITSPVTNPSVAAICKGAPGQSGTTVFTIFAGPTVAGNFSGILAEGYITAGDLVGSLQGGKVTDLVLLMNSNSVYATVGTASHPIDAMRAPIK
jgi:hypothetical protein